MSSPIWTDELPADHSSLRYHADAALSLRTNPGRWRLIGTYAYRGGATNSASQIRRGATNAWRRRPGGLYEARAITTEQGDHQVYARWVLLEKTQRSAG